MRDESVISNEVDEMRTALVSDEIKLQLLITMVSAKISAEESKLQFKTSRPEAAAGKEIVLASKRVDPYSLKASMSVSVAVKINFSAAVAPLDFKKHPEIPEVPDLLPS